MMCDKNCGFRVHFKPGARDENGVRIPHEDLTDLPHDCPNTYPYECRSCGKLIYLDKMVLSRENYRRIPLNFGTDDFHFCDWRSQG